MNGSATISGFCSSEEWLARLADKCRNADAPSRVYINELLLNVVGHVSSATDGMMKFGKTFPDEYPEAVIGHDATIEQTITELCVMRDRLLQLMMELSMAIWLD